VVNPAGAAALSWGTSFAGPRVSYRPPGGSFGPPERVEGWALSAPIALNPSGELFAATAPMSEGNAEAGTIVSARSPLGGWSLPSTIFFGGNSQRTIEPLMFTQPDGSVALVIEDPAGGFGDNKLFFATRHLDGSTSPPEVISGAISGSPRAAANLRGDILAAWDRGSRNIGDGRYDGEIVIAERDAGKSFGGEVLAARPALGGDVALNDAGQGAVVYLQLDGQGQYAGIGARVREDRSLPPLPFPPAVSIARQSDRSLGRDGSLVISPRCNTRCRISTTGVLYPGGGGIRGRAASVKLAKSRRGRVRVRFGAAGARAARRALARGRHPWVSVSVTARGRSPRSRTISRGVRLTR
jgi:hypothetical protein